MQSSSLFVPFAPALIFALGLTGCTAAVDPVAGTDGETTGGSDTSAAGPGGTAAPETSGDATDGGGDDPGSSGDASAGFLQTPDGGVGPLGLCLGRSEVGHLATIHAASTEPVDLQCDTTPAPCGGDVVGTWAIQAHCGLDALPNFFEEQCPGSTMSYLSSDVQGTRTFNADLSFAIDTSLQLDVELHLDAMQCFGLDCEAFGMLLDEEDNNLAAVCGASNTGCMCMMTITNAEAAQGTYAVTDQGLELTVDGLPGDPVPLCAIGDRLALWDTLHESQIYQDTLCDDASDCEDALGDAHDEWFCVQ